MIKNIVYWGQFVTYTCQYKSFRQRAHKYSDEKQIQRTTNAVEGYLSRFLPRFVVGESRQRKMLAKNAAMFVVKLNGMINGKKFA